MADACRDLTAQVARRDGASVVVSGGRGIGKALLLETFRAFEARRLDRVSLGVDAENASGATQLYVGIGMHEEERHDLYNLALRRPR